MYSLFYFRIFLIQILLINSGSIALRNVRLIASEAVRSGGILKLNCDYDLEGEALYSLKWYFGDNEFYRFIPKDSPSTKVFPTHGLVVDMSASNNTTVTLTQVHANLTGYYKCEVSADAPLFQTDIKSALVIVTEHPKSSPILTSEKMKYAVGETIKVNCSSAPGFPLVNLTWFVNGRQIFEGEGIKIEKDIEVSREVLKSILEMMATEELFLKNGKLIIGCEASQFKLYKSRGQLFISQDSPTLDARVLDDTPSWAIQISPFDTTTQLAFVSIPFILQNTIIM